MNKPVILLGNGVRGNPELVDYLCSLNIPILTTWMAMDLIAEDHPAFCGRPGVLGQRAANIIQQKADSLWVYGARLDEQQVAYQYYGFAPNARKYVMDIDQAELDKLPDVYHKLRIEPDYQYNFIGDIDPSWLEWSRALYDRLRPELEGEDNPRYVDPFRFISVLSDYAQPDDILVNGAGKAGEIFLQAFKVKAGQRCISLSTCGAMGYDIPLAVGAAVGTGRRVLCVTGDGGFQLNTQELEVVRRLGLPVQFFVFSNNGYGSIRAMQQARFGQVVGADPESGFTMPELYKIAECYGITYDLFRIYDNESRIVELFIDPDYVHYPRVATSLVNGEWVQDNMEDMTPKMDADELRLIMEWDG